MKKRKRKCKDEYFILFLVMDNTDRNDIVLILYTILHDIYQLNCQDMIESKVKHSNILQDKLTYNSKIFEKMIIACCVKNIAVCILIIMIMYVMNTLFSLFNNNCCRSRSSNMNTNNKDKSKSDSNNITIECTQMHIFIID